MKRHLWIFLAISISMHTIEATKVFSQGTRAGASTSTLTAATPGIDRRKCVYFIRHGRSKCNLLREMKDPRADTREVQDTELAPLGCEQASALARLTKKWELDCIMSSPLRRTLHTSALAFEGRSLPLYVYSVLRETYWEDYESRGIYNFLRFDFSTISAWLILNLHTTYFA